MAKTLVVPVHPNMTDFCMSRSHTKGRRCPGIETAEWLNGLGDDSEKWANVTVGILRSKWGSAPELTHVTFKK